MLARCKGHCGVIARFLVISSFLWSTESCSSATAPRHDSALHINQTNVVLSVGDTTSLGVTLDDGETRLHTRPTGFEPLLPAALGPEFQTDRPDVVDISPDGVFRARSPGRAVVWARVRAAHDSVTVNVATGLPTAELEQVSGGSTPTCGLTAGHDVVCWGNNWFGQAGAGSVRHFTSIVSPSRVEPPRVCRRLLPL